MAFLRTFSAFEVTFIYDTLDIDYFTLQFTLYYNKFHQLSRNAACHEFDRPSDGIAKAYTSLHSTYLSGKNLGVY